eukprot:TRINITY_DN1389_c0_g1_i1.p1 TRINITY_DN1389_c0_g1~~TRINITY_DN1389_c0_g1_i1.p1  ORF type:complete len:201 (+),score=28.10 TRINITY_DN1389_c0_g1_i1:34-636(+)
MPPTYATSDTRVFVGNLPQGVDRRDVEDIFHKFGEVTDVWIARNPETGFGFVYFRDRRDAEDACRECNRKEKLGGNMLRVEVSHEQPATDARRGKGSKGGGKGRDDYDDRRDDDVRRNDTVDYRRDDRRDDDYRSGGRDDDRKRRLSRSRSRSPPQKRRVSPSRSPPPKRRVSRSPPPMKRRVTPSRSPPRRRVSRSRSR